MKTTDSHIRAGCGVGKTHGQQAEWTEADKARFVAQWRKAHCIAGDMLWWFLFVWSCGVLVVAGLLIGLIGW